MNTYKVLLHIHVLSVLLSGVLFLLRGKWMILKSPRLNARWVKVLPHIVDTILLASALGMAFGFYVNPFGVPWLQAKVVALVVYIALGVLAFRRQQVWAWFAALMVFFYIVMVAMSKSPFPVISA